MKGPITKRLVWLLSVVVLSCAVVADAQQARNRPGDGAQRRQRPPRQQPAPPAQPAPPTQQPAPQPQQPPAGGGAITEGVAGFDNATNGSVDQAAFDESKEEFDAAEEPDEGLGPIFNAQACRECHQTPVSGAGAQTMELRVGHRGPNGVFVNPTIRLPSGETVTGRSLVNDRAICADGQELVPDSENIRTFRLAISLLGDGYIEAIADQTIIDLARQQCASSGGTICGQVLRVPLTEAPGQTRVGRFGWKNQHSSLLSFAADAYINEMGITNRLIPDEFTERTCIEETEGVEVPNDPALPAGQLDAIDHFTRFMRALKAPARNEELAATPAAQRGSTVFDQVGCATCHVRTLITAPAGTRINAGTFTIPPALGNKRVHPFSDYLLHNVGTGDGILQVAEGTTVVGVFMPSRENFGRRIQRLQMLAFTQQDLAATQFKIRTAPLWGVRLRSRLMHDGASVTFSDAIQRHRGEASAVTARFNQLSNNDRDALLTFLRSL